MGIFENFPYSNIHNMNLDWLIEICKEIDDDKDAAETAAASAQAAAATITALTARITALESAVDDLEERVEALEGSDTPS